MQRFFQPLIAFSVLQLMFAVNTADAGADEIVGEWFPPDAAALLRIERKQGTYAIQIVRQSGDRVLHPEVKDIGNPDLSLRERSLEGLEIGHGFRFHRDRWKDGLLYDPATGREYQASIDILDEHHLRVRGFIGLSLFGRSQIWTSKAFFSRNLSRLLHGAPSEGVEP
jgi:uncharacterized protein (DUF2147 family)